MDEIIIIQKHIQIHSEHVYVRHSHIMLDMKFWYTHMRRIIQSQRASLLFHRVIFDVFVCVNCVTLYKVLYICFYWYVRHTKK